MYAKNTVKYDDSYGYTYNTATMPVKPSKPKQKQTIKPKKKKKKGSLLARIVALSLLSVLGLLIVPTQCKFFNQTFVNNKIQTTESDNVICSNDFTPTGGVNYNELINPTLSYLTNYTFFNQRLSYNVASNKKAQMAQLKYNDRLTELETELKNLNKSYANIKPAIFVWSMDNYNYVNINADKIYPAASIIKLPVLIQLYRAIEWEQIGLKDTMYLTEYYRSPGSGNMQYAQQGNAYSIYDLAKVMIQDSDNTATNMLISKLGSMNDINAALKNWGIKHTHVQTWLPDLTGTNYTTARDMGQILYNIGNDDSSFLNINSQGDIVNIMSKVKNVNLIKAGLPENVSFIHKTGDIGTMLGDAGIVYLPSGQRYIVVILAHRPHNDPNGKLYIQNASKIIYNYMSTRN